MCIYIYIYIYKTTINNTSGKCYNYLKRTVYTLNSLYIAKSVADTLEFNPECLTRNTIKCKYVIKIIILEITHFEKCVSIYRKSNKIKLI